METTVYIHECQDFARTSNSIQKSRCFQCCSMYLLLPLCTLLGLLIGGMVVVWTEPVRDQTDVIRGFNNYIKIAGVEENYIFNVPQNGTYFIKCKVQKNETRATSCKDDVRLLHLPDRTELIEAHFTNNTGHNEAVITYEGYLKEGSNVSIQFNCNIKDPNAKLSYYFNKVS